MDLALNNCWGISYRWIRPHVTYTDYAPFCAISAQSRCSLSELSPRTVIFMIVLSWVGGGFSQLSFMDVLFSFNIFLITHFRVVLSFQLPFDNNNNLQWLICHKTQQDETKPIECVRTDKTIHLIFYEQAVCGRGSKMRKGLLYTCDEDRHVDLRLPNRARDSVSTV